MNPGRLTVAVVVVLGAALALSTSAAADPVGTAAKRAKTDVTISNWPDGLFGYVTSSKAKCAESRRVTLFKRRGSGDDKKIGATKTQPNEGEQQWSVETGKSGKFYAKAKGKRKCRAGASERFKTGGATVPLCPSTESVCQFTPTLHLDITEHCSSFSVASDFCVGRTRTGPTPWSPSSDGRIRWQQKPGTAERSFSYDTSGDADIAELIGTVPGPGSADFRVSRAFAPAWNRNVGWKTPNLSGVRAGEQGGPLYLNFHGGTVGADIYIHGFLYRSF